MCNEMTNVCVISPTEVLILGLEQPDPIPNDLFARQVVLRVWLEVAGLAIRPTWVDVNELSTIIDAHVSVKLDIGRPLPLTNIDGRCKWRNAAALLAARRHARSLAVTTLDKWKSKCDQNVQLTHLY